MKDFKKDKLVYYCLFMSEGVMGDLIGQSP